MSKDHRVLSWLRELRESRAAGDPVEDVGPVWEGSVLPSRPNSKQQPPAPNPEKRKSGKAEGQSKKAPSDSRRSVRYHPAFTPERLRGAWRVVRANGGGAGVDGVNVAKFEASLQEELDDLAVALAKGEYRPQKVQRLLIPKSDGGLRPLGIWTIRDRVVQRALYEALMPLCEPHFLPCSFGYRPRRGIPQALQTMVAARDQGQRWVLEGDIRDCFDSIRREPLLRALGHWVADPVLLELTDHFLTARIFNSVSGGAEMAGASQGSVLSPLLCNVYLHAFDQAMMSEEAGVLTLVRFADDFVVLAGRRRDAEAAQARVATALGELRLLLHPRKTRVIHFDQGFKFLGHFFVKGDVYQL